MLHYDVWQNERGFVSLEESVKAIGRNETLTNEITELLEILVDRIDCCPSRDYLWKRARLPGLSIHVHSLERGLGHDNLALIVGHFVNETKALLFEFKEHASHRDDVTGVKFLHVGNVLIDCRHAAFG